MTLASLMRTSVIMTVYVAIGLSFSSPSPADQVKSAQVQLATSSGQDTQGEGTTGTLQPMPGAPYMREPSLDPVKGRKLFVTKGCVACHSVNHVGGNVAAPLDASIAGPVPNPFDVAAMMWRMAPYMIAKQEEKLGNQIFFTGDELSDIIAFLYDPEEQKKLSESDLTPEARKMLGETHQ